VNEFEKCVAQVAGEGLHSCELRILQVNRGLRCNQQCAHCHLAAGPERVEMMDWPTMESVLGAAGSGNCELVDITGGAPELNPHFRRFVSALRGQGRRVQVRTNLTVLLEPGLESLPEFLRDHQVQLVASLPCYTEENVTAQRGPGVFQRSVTALKRLNALGYGTRSDLDLNLVYNPGGGILPGPQEALEADYRRELGERFSVTFTRLLTITNAPLGRFLTVLGDRGRQAEYLALLRESFNAETVPGLMCRHQLSVGWDGTLYDCDFNLALRCPVDHGAPDHISRFDPATLAGRRVVTGEHCFACTAGRGSSCAGVLVKE